MPEELICPYCEKEQDCHEPDEIDAEFALTECEHCGKSFWYSVTVTRDYDSWTDEEDKAMMTVAENHYCGYGAKMDEEQECEI